MKRTRWGVTSILMNLSGRDITEKILDKKIQQHWTAAVVGTQIQQKMQKKKI